MKSPVTQKRGPLSQEDECLASYEGKGNSEITRRQSVFLSVLSK